MTPKVLPEVVLADPSATYPTSLWTPKQAYPSHVAWGMVVQREGEGRSTNSQSQQQKAV